MKIITAKIKLSMAIIIISYPHFTNITEYTSMTIIGAHYTIKLTTVVINKGLITLMYLSSMLALKYLFPLNT